MHAPDMRLGGVNLQPDPVMEHACDMTKQEVVYRGDTEAANT